MRLPQNRKEEAGSIARVAAPDIEELVVAALQNQVMDGSRAGGGFSFRLFEAERHDGVEPRGSMSRIEGRGGSTARRRRRMSKNSTSRLIPS
jgi:hypothetical protein